MEDRQNSSVFIKLIPHWPIFYIQKPARCCCIASLV